MFLFVCFITKFSVPLIGHVFGLCGNLPVSCLWKWAGLCSPLPSPKPRRSPCSGFWPESSESWSCCAAVLQTAEMSSASNSGEEKSHSSKACLVQPGWEMWAQRCFFFFLSKINTCSVRRDEIAERACSRETLRDKIPTVVLGWCNTTWSSGWKDGLGFFHLPLAVRHEEMGTKEISGILSFSFSSKDSLHTHSDADEKENWKCNWECSSGFCEVSAQTAEMQWSCCVYLIT